MAVALSIAALPSPVQAQGALPAAWAVDDPAGDTAAGAPAAAAPFADIVHAEGFFGDDGMDVLVEVAALQGDGATYASSWELWLGFEYRSVRFDVVLMPKASSVTLPGPAEGALFAARDGYLFRMTDGPTRIAPIPVGVVAGKPAFNTTLPWILLDVDGFTPQPGEAIRLLDVGSAWNPSGFSTPHQPFIADASAATTTDLAPFPDGTFLSVPGAVGDISVATPLAVRYSNGEATTFHWPVEVANHGKRTLDLTFSMQRGQAQEVRYPPGVHLRPGETKTVSVFVTMPFLHEHGSLRSFPLTVDSGAGDRATLQLAIDYPAIPQPAGHHPELWLHGGSADVFGLGAVETPYGMWMNTLQEDPDSVAATFSPGFTNCPADPADPAGALNQGFLWAFPLSPALRIGLDARPGGNAVLDLRLQGAAAVPAGTLLARVVLSSATDFVGSLDTFRNATDPAIGRTAVPLTPGPTPVDLHLEFPLPPELDLLPPVIQDSFALLVAFCPDLPSGATSAVVIAGAFASVLKAPLFLVDGARLLMPLDEYHDVIPVVGSGGPTLATAEPLRHARAGTTVLWHVTAAFAANDTGRYQARLLGQGADAATLLTAADLKASDGTVDLAISLVVPDAAPGSALDMLLDVTDLQDPGRTAALRLGVVVDPAAEGDQADEAAALTAPAKDSPGAGWAPLLAVLAALVAARRR